MKKIGLIGCGRWGRNLARNIAHAPRAHLRYFCDLDAAALADLKSRYGYVNVTADYREVIGDHDVDAVFIATPTNEHTEIAVAAMEAGKDVYIEAPMADTVEGAGRIVAAAARTGRTVEVGHLHPHNSILARMKALLAESQGGRYLYAHRFTMVRGDGTRHSLNSSDLVFAFAHHDLFAMAHLLGAEPVSVDARSYRVQDHDYEDVVTINLAFAGGARGHIHLSVLAPLKERRLTAVARDRMLVYDDSSVDAKLRIYEIEDPEIFSDGRRSDSYSDFQQIQRSGRLVVPNLIAHEPLSVAVERFVAVLHDEAAPCLDAPAGARFVGHLETIRRATVEKRELEFGKDL